MIALFLTELGSYLLVLLFVTIVLAPAEVLAFTVYCRWGDAGDVGTNGSCLRSCFPLLAFQAPEAWSLPPTLQK